MKIYYSVSVVQLCFVMWSSVALRCVMLRYVVSPYGMFSRSTLCLCVLLYRVMLQRALCCVVVLPATICVVD